MPRVKKGTKGVSKRKKILKAAAGYRGARSRLLRSAKEAVEHGMANSYRDRRRRKRNFRSLWIQRINAAARIHGVSYSSLMAALAKNKVAIDRKMLADVALNDPTAFAKLAEMAVKN